MLNEVRSCLNLPSPHGGKQELSLHQIDLKSMPDCDWTIPNEWDKVLILAKVPYAHALLDVVGANTQTGSKKRAARQGRQ